MSISRVRIIDETAPFRSVLIEDQTPDFSSVAVVDYSSPVSLVIANYGATGPSGSGHAPDPSAEPDGSILEVQGGSLAYTRSLENSALTIDGGIIE